MRRATPEYRAEQRKYASKPENKAKEKERRKTPEYKAKQKKRMSTPEYKARQRWRQSQPKYKATKKKYSLTPISKAKDKKRVDKIRLKVLQYYSKHLSKSDIPCCWCCGENFHIDFLAVDHITGRKEMDSELKLVKLGYSSSMVGTTLLTWIIKNNFPEGFKILCHNCNSAKGFYGKCPHEK